MSVKEKVCPGASWQKIIIIIIIIIAMIIIIIIIISKTNKKSYNAHICVFAIGTME